MAEDITILKEIDDSLKLENMENFLRNYGKLLITFAAVIVLATGFSVFMKQRNLKHNGADTHILLQAEKMAAEGKYQDAITLLSFMGSEKREITALAHFRIAENEIALGNVAEAKAQYEMIANNPKNDDALRNLAQLDRVIVASNHAMGETDSNSLKKIMEKNTVGSELAGAMLALEQEKTGNSKLAHETLDNTIKSPNITNAQKQIATELQNGYEAIATKEEKK